MIDDRRSENIWQMKNRMSSRDGYGKRLMHFKNINREIMTDFMTSFDKGEIMEELFDLLLQLYQEGLERTVKVSEFAFDYVNGLVYNCHNISLNYS